MAICQNEVLASLLASGSRARLEPHLRSADLQQGQVLAEPFERMTHVYFPNTGAISFSVPLQKGHLVQTGLVGRDGVVGALQSMDASVSPTKIIVQIAGRAATVEARRFTEVVRDDPTGRSLILRHEQFFLSEVQQSAACNAVHTVRQRVCRWILRMNDLVGINVAVTQELIARMIGVTRSSVSGAAASVQAEGIIQYRRGHIQIVDIDRLKELSCECYQTLRQYRLAQTS